MQPPPYPYFVMCRLRYQPLWHKGEQLAGRWGRDGLLARARLQGWAGEARVRQLSAHARRKDAKPESWLRADAFRIPECLGQDATISSSRRGARSHRPTPAECHFSFSEKICSVTFVDGTYGITYI